MGLLIINDHQWPFQDPKLEVPTIYKAYVRPKFQGISPQNMARNMVLTYLHQLDLEDLPFFDQFWGTLSSRLPAVPHPSERTWSCGWWCRPRRYWPIKEPRFKQECSMEYLMEHIVYNLLIYLVSYPIIFVPIYQKKHISIYSSIYESFDLSKSLSMNQLTYVVFIYKSSCVSIRTIYGDMLREYLGIYDQNYDGHTSKPSQILSGWWFQPL